MKQKRSKILDAVHDTVSGMLDAGVVDEVTMREFDAMCLPPLPKLDAEKIKEIRQRQHVSQSVFAAYVGVSKSTVAQWEQGEKKPRGASLKLLDLVSRKGLEVLA